MARSFGRQEMLILADGWTNGPAFAGETAGTASGISCGGGTKPQTWHNSLRSQMAPDTASVRLGLSAEECGSTSSLSVTQISQFCHGILILGYRM